MLASWHCHLAALATTLIDQATELVELPNAIWQAHSDRYAARRA